MSREAQIEGIDQPWQQEIEEILDAYQVDPDKGLNPSEVKERRERFGKNRLQSKERKSAWVILVEQFKSIIVWLLVASAGLSFIFGEVVDGIAVVAVVVINAAIGFTTELRAVRSMEALREMGSVEAKVLREGQITKIEAEKLVPGDMVSVDGGDVITADIRLIEASKLQANESALTGESVPVSKSLEPLEGDVPVAERTNMLFKGTSVTRGVGKGVVVSTGMDTQLGEISSLVAEAEQEATPLEERLDQLGQKLVWVTLAIITLVALAGILQGKEFLLMIETSIALAVAAVPEGLPIVATIALARGMTRMARRNALINKLAAVETLGGTNVVCTDKTGTLTENQMTVTRLELDGKMVEVSGEGLELDGEFSQDGGSIDPRETELLRKALQVGVLCNNATVQQDENQAIGEPVEVALLVAGIKAGFARDELLERMPEEREVAFDPEVKMMATYHSQDGEYRVAVKGAPEAVLEACAQIQEGDGRVALDDEARKRWLEKNKELAEEGLRILALATKTVDSTEAQPYKDLIFLGLVGMLDPPREEVRQAILTSQDAGVQVVMVTGDQPITARNIAQAVGLADKNVEVIHGSELKPPDQLSSQERERLLEAPIFARVSPKQKLDLIAIHQGAGSIVAMTGDGVNDAPALKKADIGIAMGQRGTQVAREAADMVLEDDAFNTIIEAIRQGRTIFNNIRRFVLYLISCNVSEIMVVFLASLANAPLPIRPLQILFLNLVTDVFPALALGVSEGDPGVMERPPRDPEEPVLTRRHWLELSGYSFVITLSVLGAFALAFSWLQMSLERTVTISFLTLAFAQLWHVFNMRDHGSHPLRNDVMENVYVWGAIVICVALLLGAVYIPILAQVLNVVDPGPQGWALVLGASVIPLILGQIWNQIKL